MIVVRARSQLDADRLTFECNMPGRTTYGKKQGKTLDTSNRYCRQYKRDFVPRAYDFTFTYNKEHTRDKT
jgi:hypothetical protein